ncbi:MAG: chromosome segregation protein SMC, partial [Bryobacteraceae bacterium]
MPLLKLKRLDLQGFKSFPDRAELRFTGSGIAAIVGPNGCGKSNIADAINWVIGEQSAKTLRGARMEDVIFAGTRDRKPVGLASVTMTLVEPDFEVERVNGSGKTNGKANGHNGDGASSLQIAEATNGTNGHAANGTNGHATNGTNGTNGIHAVNGANGVNGKAASQGGREIVITRRLFRSGESEYLIDGRAARLRDIQDIFMGTGLGPESYAIIEQGRIGQLLSSRPQDRRNVIEEAAGISKFKSRRRLAEAKLEGAKHNLERVFDILEEVGRQANSLRRQAAKARRYEEVKSEMNAQLRRVLAARYTMLERETAKIALDLNLATANAESLSSEAAAREQEYSRSQAAGYQNEAELTEARKRLSELNLELERTRGRLDSQAKQAGSIEQRLTLGETESQDLESRSARLAEELAAARDGLAAQQEQTEAARARLEAKGRERDSIAGSLGERERSIESSRQQTLRLLGEISQLKNQLAEIDAYLAALDRDTAKSQKEEQTATADLEWAAASRNELSAKLSARQLELESLADQRRRIEEELAARKRDLAGARREMETARAEFSRLKARRDSLEEILSHRAYTTESVKKLFTAIERGQADGLKPIGVLADFVEVEPAYEKAAEEFLHDELEYVVVENRQQAERGIEVLRTSVEGRATFLVHPEPSAAAAGQADAIAADPGVTAPLTQVLRLTNGLSHAAYDFLPRLSQCYLAADRAAAQRLAVEHPGHSFLLSDGICYHGLAVSGGKKSSSGPLALKRELRESQAQVQTRQKQLEESAARIEGFERDILRLEHELERLRSAQQSQEKEAVALDHEMRKLADDLARATSRVSVARLELDRLAREKERSAAKRNRNLADIQEKDAARARHETALEAARQDLDALKAGVSRTGEEHSALRVELAGLEERRRASGASMARIETQSNELAARAKEVAALLERLGVERARLLADNIELDKRIADIAAGQAAAEELVSALAAREAELRATLAALEETLKLLRLEFQQAQQKRSEIELELVKRQTEMKFLDETSRKELDVRVAELCGEDELALDDGALAELETRYAELRRKLEALGPVNPEALAEYQEAQ